MNKNIYIFILALICFTNTKLKGQVAIEKDTFISEGSAMEFNDQRTPSGVAKGIILPYVNDLTPESKAGTIYYDSNSKKVMLVTDINEKVALTPSSESTTLPDYSSLKEEGKGVYINSEDNEGVLAFSTENKALLLPYVKNVELMPLDTEPGTIVYDAASKSIAIYNGTEWSLLGIK